MVDCRDITSVELGDRSDHCFRLRFAPGREVLLQNALCCCDVRRIGKYLIQWGDIEFDHFERDRDHPLEGECDVVTEAL
ncbi:TPA: hypothetical protein DCS34_04150 [Candidatus Peribacteria bacterium]|nr:hypothetical protein [Candidatus Peribacteria bacterium]